MTPAPKYWAFLSYSHADEGAARGLHRALERYRLPRGLRRARGLPPRLYPVFRDVEELAPGASLSQRLRDALDASRWLVVLCSRKARESKYVSAEIEHFLSRHGPERVLCVLLDGEPPGCLPEPIRALGEEPLAADFRAGADRKTATLRLVAAIAGVGFGELQDREARRARRLTMAMAAALAAATLGGTAWWQLYRRDHVEHYAEYTRVHGVWTGIDALPADAPRSYRFTRLGRLGPPRRVDYVDAAGDCPPGGMPDQLGERPAADFCSATFEYKGEVIEEHDFSELGDDYGYGIGALRDEGGVILVMTSQKPGTPPRMHFIRARRDDRGFDTELRFWSTPGVASRDRKGNLAYVIERDSEGRVVKVEAKR